MKTKDFIYVIIIAIIIFIGVMFYFSYCSPCGEQLSKEDYCYLLMENQELRRENDSLQALLGDCQKGKIVKKVITKKPSKRVAKKTTKEEVPEATITLRIPDDFIEEAPPVEVLEVKQVSLPQRGMMTSNASKVVAKKKAAPTIKPSVNYQDQSGNDKVTVYGYKDRPKSWYRYGAN